MKEIQKLKKESIESLNDSETDGFIVITYRDYRKKWKDPLGVKCFKKGIPNDLAFTIAVMMLEDDDFNAIIQRALEAKEKIEFAERSQN